MSDAHRKLIDDPDRLIEDLIEDMVSAHPDLLCVEGDTGRAIVALNGPREGKTGIVVGGGPGNEPAFAGYVGKGLVDASPLGNIFALPSPAQIMDAADGRAGMLFLNGNYPGDGMNFGMAAKEVGNLASLIGAGAVVLTHNGLGEGGEGRAATRVSGSFDGPVHGANDLESF